jgi:hypothetical protein
MAYTISLIRNQILPGIFIFFLTIIISGCPDPVESTDVDQTKIYQIYTAEYYADNLDVVSTAEFRMNSQTGSYVKLTGDSHVKLNSQTMSEQNILNSISYVFHISNSSLLNTYKWEYKNGAGTTFINETNLSSLVTTLLDIADTIHKTESYQFRWYEPVVSGETLTLELRNSDSVLASIRTTAAGTSSILISSSTFQQYPTGRITVKAKKNDQLNTQQNNPVGGIIQRIYSSTAKTFVLVP